MEGNITKGNREGFLTLAESFTFEGHYGTTVFKNVGIWPFITQRYGIYAAHEIEPSISVNNWHGIYAPTSMAPNNSPFESGTVYWYQYGSNHVQFFVYNHYSGTYYTETVDNNWIQKYVRTVNGKAVYYVMIVKLNGVWYSTIYNWNMGGAFEIKAQTTNSGPYTDGWSYFEIHINNQLPTIPRIDDFSLQSFDGSSWHTVDWWHGRIYDNSAAFSSEYYYGHVSNYDAWYVGPNKP